MLTSARTIIVLVAAGLTVLAIFKPIPLWIPLLLVEIAFFVPDAKQ